MRAHLKSSRAAYAYGCEANAAHENVSHRRLSRRLAKALGYDFNGDLRRPSFRDRCYLIPRQSLCSRDDPSADRPEGEYDLFGGWMPEPHMATKAIMHPRISGAAEAPAGWSDRLALKARDVALPGFTAFTARDALAAGHHLLGRGGAIRLKPATANGGRGQVVIEGGEELEASIAGLDPAILASGLVLEENLTRVETYSVGQVRAPGQTISYFGTQRTTKDNNGHPVYGGSRLFLVRGGFDALLARAGQEKISRAITFAARFDQLADRCLPGLVASRRNYDVAHGMTADGEWRLGVMEQSWRIGGASGAEIIALEKFLDPSVSTVTASTTELYGDGNAPPEDAFIIYRGRDTEAGPLLKYARLEESFAG